MSSKLFRPSPKTPLRVNKIHQSKYFALGRDKNELTFYLTQSIARTTDGIRRNASEEKVWTMIRAFIHIEFSIYFVFGFHHSTSAGTTEKKTHLEKKKNRSITKSVRSNNN